MSKVLAFEFIKPNKVSTSININHPRKRYNSKDDLLNLFLLKILKIVPKIDRAKTPIKIGIPEYSYRVIKHTGAYEPAIK